jgi:DNA-binding CsgD family transcriptional regulator
MSGNKPVLDPVELYTLWLSGKSLRAIGKMFGVGRMAIYGTLSRAYGKDCCTLRKQSLARIVFKEYGDMDLAIKAKGIEGLFRSEKTENSYSEHQSCDISTKNIRAVVSTYEEGISLPLYYKVSQLTTRLIYLTMMSRMNKLT